MSLPTITYPSNGVESRGMPTRPVEDEPEEFNGFAAIHKLLYAREKAREAMDEIDHHKRVLAIADIVIRKREAQLVEAFRGSDVEAVDYVYAHQRYTIACIKDELVVLKVGYTHELRPPIHESFESPVSAPVAAHAATDDDDDPELTADTEPEPSLMAVS